jgi:hypothetical protein
MRYDKSSASMLAMTTEESTAWTALDERARFRVFVAYALDAVATHLTWLAVLERLCVIGHLQNRPAVRWTGDPALACYLDLAWDGVDKFIGFALNMWGLRMMIRGSEAG